MNDNVITSFDLIFSSLDLLHGFEISGRFHISFHDPDPGAFGTLIHAKKACVKRTLAETKPGPARVAGPRSRTRVPGIVTRQLKSR